MSISTGMAAANPHNPIVGPAAVATAGETVAFLESERDQNATDLNGDGDALDEVLRVFDLTGTEITPSSTLVGRSFPGVSRAPVVISGSLVFYREPAPGVSLMAGGGLGGGGSTASMVVAPDGRFAYLTAPGTSRLAAYKRDAETGDLYGNQSPYGPATLETIADDQLPGITGLGGASGLAVSPDSRFLYVAGALDDAIQVLEPFPTQFHSGSIEGVEVETDGQGGVDGLAGVTRLAISPDGAHLYASGTAEDAIAVFSRNVVDGTLAFVEAQFDGVGANAGLGEPRGLAISPDGAHVYVAARGSSAVTAFSRNAGTGALTFLATYPDGGLGGPSLAGATEVVISSDGENVYLTASDDDAVSVFSRDTLTGALAFLEAKVEGAGGVTGIAGARALAIAPEGQTVYAGGENFSFAVFQRVVPGGTLAFVEAEPYPYGPSPHAMACLAVSPDSEHLHALSDSGGALIWRRNGGLRAFDTATMTLRAGLGAQPAGLAAAAAGRAIFLSPEGNGGGTNQNGDTDTDDQLIYAYDAATDMVTQLAGVSAFPARRVALSATLLAVQVMDTGMGPGDLDGSGNGSLAIGVVPTTDLGGTPTFIPDNAHSSLEMQLTDLCADGTRRDEPCVTDTDCPGSTCAGVVVFASGETVGSLQDLNGDGDHVDQVPEVYWSATGELVVVPQALSDFIVGGNLLAFRVLEAPASDLVNSAVSEDLNGDGDLSDSVLMVYDLKARRLINSGQAIVHCELPGCTPGRPYKIVGDAVAFLTNEADQGGQDLDGDGSNTGIVAQIFNVRGARRKVFSTQAGAPNLPPLPDDFVGQSIVYQEYDESEVGVDLNGDGDTNDLVNVITGDNDADGVFNEDDTCVEAPDAKALDSDLDGLGDVCDPNPYCNALTPANPIVAPSANKECQKALGKAVRGYLLARTNSIRGCLTGVAKGKIAGPAAIACRGSSLGGQEVALADAKTAAKLAKARAKFDATIAGSCGPADLGALDPCATSVAGVETCLAERITTGVDAMLALAYGDVGAITDKATLKCQTALGGAAAGYLKAAAGAMVGCLDKRNQGAFSGNGQTLCLGASTPTGIVAPAEPGTGDKLTKAEAKVQKALETKCAGALLGNLDTCGVTPAAVTDCLVCSGWRRVLETVRGAYGVP